MKLATVCGMKEYAAGIESSELRLVDAAPAKTSETDAPQAPASSVAGANNGSVAPRNGSAQPSAAIAPYNHAAPSASASSPSAKVPDESGMPAVDRFLTAATKEFEAGMIDQPLWKHAATQSGGDRTVATRNYLRARATALRVTKREKRQERSARRARALNELAQPGDADHGAAPRTEAGTSPASVPRRVAPPKGMQVVWIGGALAGLFIIALFVALRSESDAAQHSDAAVKSPVAANDPGTKTTRPTTAAKAETRKRDDAAREDWAGKLEKLKGEGHWNVVVLYAGEWVRAQPDNAAAWKELAAGYVKLRQYRDALDAANKVVQLAPEDAGAWQSLGQLNVALRQPVEALAAFEQAVARDEHDAASVTQIGTLATQLGRYPDARAAFAKALALNPVDVDALCGAASLAQKEQRAKDAEALMRQVVAQDARCRDPAEGQSVRVAVGK
jgi:cytochrome c-type biogenesis protein CcmH/NrfG